MMSNELLKEILEAAREEEIRRGAKVSHIYVVGERYFFDASEVEGMEVDYTLVRSDMDPNFPSSALNTNNHIPKKLWDA